MDTPLSVSDTPVRVRFRAAQGAAYMALYLIYLVYTIPMGSSSVVLQSVYSLAREEGGAPGERKGEGEKWREKGGGREMERGAGWRLQ